MTETPQAVDPEEFVGEPPAGDANPRDFMSNDQSAPAAEEPAGEQEEGDAS